MKSNRFYPFILILTAMVFLLGTGMVAAKEGGKIVHDAEHNILKAQHGQRWAKEDAEIDAKLADIRKKNNGKAPNFVFILLDDLGFGEIGMPDLDVIRGYSTPRISKMADEGSGRRRRPGGLGSDAGRGPEQGRLRHGSYGEMAPGRR